MMQQRLYPNKPWPISATFLDPFSHLFMYELEFFFNPLSNYVDAWALPLRPSLFPFAVSNRQRRTSARNPDFSRLLEVMNSLYSQVLSPILRVAPFLASRANSFYRISINPDIQPALQYIPLAFCLVISSPNMNNSPLGQEKNIPSRDDVFNITFPTVQTVSEDSARPNNLETSPYRLHGDTPSDEALRKIRTANSITISPGTVFFISQTN